MSDSTFEEEHNEVAQSSAASVNGTDEGKENQEGSSSSDDKIVERADNRAVRCSKVAVLVVIAVAALAFGTATYFFTDNEEEDNFEIQFKDYANEIGALAHIESENAFGLLESMAITIASYSLASNVSWPFITMPHFEQRGTRNNELSKALQLSLVPLLLKDLKAEWEDYAAQSQGWVQLGVDASPSLHRDYLGSNSKVPQIPARVFRFENGQNGSTVPQEEPGVDVGPGNYAVVWQQAPAPHNPSIVNFDLLSHPVFKSAYHEMWETSLPVVTEVTDLSFLYDGAVTDDATHPHSALLYPIFSSLDRKGGFRDDLLGFLVAVMPWDAYFANLIPTNINGMVVVVSNGCGDDFSYRLDGPQAVFLGMGDLHDSQYNHLEISTEFAPFLYANLTATHASDHIHCDYKINSYPTSSLEETYRSNKPWAYALAVVIVFTFTAGVFIFYDYLVQRRQNNVLTKAKRTNAIVSALFPSNVRDRILRDAEQQAENEERDRNMKANFKFGASKDQLKHFLDDEENRVSQPYSTKPIADLFPSATVMFADIVGFTAWSSVREPSQVFTLLETIYHSFDETAKRRRVFKVETIGDCYVAVAGLPDPRPDHAVVMARFAKECLTSMNALTKKLEFSLGPDTGDLSMRIGLHSGPVTAGVLRGDKSRFQLFGDTVNTAARIEASGERNRIHLSEETAQQLVKSNKGHWVTQRTDVVQAKGKGALETFWLDPQLRSSPSVVSDGKQESATAGGISRNTRLMEVGLKPKVPSEDEKMNRLIGWNTDVLGRLLKQIIARRNAAIKLGKIRINKFNAVPQFAPQDDEMMVLDEVKEIIQLPAFDAVVVENQEDPGSIVLDPQVTDQLKDFVGTVALLYHNNPFHNFEHASHVTMSVVKLLSRITTADALVDRTQERDASSLHDFTYGITSDPLTQFACVFAALIHDVDHSGVPNTQLIKEDSYLARLYKNKSIAEQNSVDIAWKLFMNDKFAAVRDVICTTSEDTKRFRELVVNSVMATDIMDKDLKALRNARWDKAFSEAAVTDSAEDSVNRKATIVIEHLIQASDVAHTMQHWHIYRKWNERLFHELLLAYRAGRAETDPTDFWYKGEMGFFDFYIIPLAKKLKDCGVFGVSSDEYLNYAEKNRREWELKGQEVIENMINNHRTEYPAPTPEDVEKASLLRFEVANRSSVIDTGTVVESSEGTCAMDEPVDKPKPVHGKVFI
ncbi:hypothetical protein ACA910_021144 [Epithemia clementina (nom. ined.)]